MTTSPLVAIAVPTPKKTSTKVPSTSAENFWLVVGAICETAAVSAIISPSSV